MTERLTLPRRGFKRYIALTTIYAALFGLMALSVRIMIASVTR